MTAFLIFIHVIVSILLCTIVLMQSGRGGGLTENFAAAGDMLGTQTSEFLIKGTTVLAIVFLVTSLSLAFLSAKKDESLMANKVAAEMPVDAAAVAGNMINSVQSAEMIPDENMPATQNSAAE